MSKTSFRRAADIDRPPAEQSVSPGSAEAGLGYELERITAPERLEALIPQWRELVRSALVPALCQEPEWVMATIRHVPRCDDIETLAVWAPNPIGAPTLAGMLGVKPAPWRWGVPDGPARSMVHGHVFDSTPLLHAHHGDAAMQAIFELCPGPVLFESVPDRGPFLATLRRAASNTGRRVETFDEFQRGTYRPDQLAQDYLKATHSRGRRYKFRKWRSRLGRDGTLELQWLKPNGDLKPWLGAFQDLEAGGWKGRSGTAIASSRHDIAFFGDVLTAFHVNRRLLFWNLALDDKPVAMLFGVRHGRHVALGKITYDENYAQFSPGALLLLDCMDQLYREGATDFVDSCGRPGNAMIDALWRDRLAIGDVLVSASGATNYMFLAQCGAETARRTMFKTAKALYGTLEQIARQKG